MSQSHLLSPTYAELLSVLPAHVRSAATICSIPHWLDDPLALSLVNRFANQNGKIEETVGSLKSLPIVYPYENRGWRVVPEVREYLIDRHLETDSYITISAFLVSVFDAQLDEMPESSTARREIQWRAAFHAAAPTPNKSIERLDEFTKFFDETQIADMKAAVDLCIEQTRWLSSYEDDIAYFKGRYAYECHDYESAKQLLQITWAAGRITRRRAIAGHFLGVIARRTGQPRGEAEQLVREAIDLFVQLKDDYGEAHACNTLAAILRDRSAFSEKDESRRQLIEAMTFARRSLKISEDKEYFRNIVYASVTLASILLNLDPAKHRPEIKNLLYGARVLSEHLNLTENLLAALNTEAQSLRQVGDYQGAAQYLRNAIELDPNNNRLHYQLAVTLIELGESEFEEAEDELMIAKKLKPRDRAIDAQLQRLQKMRRAIELKQEGKTSSDSAEDCYNLGKAYEKEKNHDTAIRCYENAIRLGDERPIVKFKLGRLLAIKESRRKEAVELFTQAVEGGLRDIQTLASLARTLHMLGNSAEAEPYFDEALHKDVNARNAQLRNWYGLFLMEAKMDYRRAYEYLTQASKLEPAAPFFANDVGRVILEAGWEDRFAEARKWFNQAIELSDEEFQWPRIYLEMLDKLEGRGRRE